MLIQQKDPSLLTKNWLNDLDKALSQAKEENRPVLVFFVGETLKDTTRRMLKTTLSKSLNQKAIADGKFIRVHVKLDFALKSEPTKQYKIQTLPTMVILDSNGKELNRRKGFIGEMDFRSGFFDCKQIHQPPE